MALIKDIETNYGVIARYWRIFEKCDKFDQSNNKVALLGWVNKAARFSGKDPLIRADFDITGIDYKADMSRAEIYALLKTRPDWSDAVDDN